jgi:integrase
LSLELRHPGYTWSNAERPFDSVATRSGPRTYTARSDSRRCRRGQVARGQSGALKAPGIRVPKPGRTVLEIDQLVALLDAVGELEAAPRSQKRAKLTASEVKGIRERLHRGETQYALRLEFGLSSGSMSMLATGRTYRGDNGRVGSRALLAALGYAGPRIAEALDLLERDVRLHDPSASRLWVSDSKTETGVRHVEVTPKLHEILLSQRMPRHLRLALTLAKRTMGAAGFEPATSRV